MLNDESNFIFWEKASFLKDTYTFTLVTWKSFFKVKFRRKCLNCLVKNLLARDWNPSTFKLTTLSSSNTLLKFRNVEKVNSCSLYLMKEVKSMAFRW